MNKTILTLAIFAFCLAPIALSANMRGAEAQDNRELTAINLGNLGNLGSIIGALVNSSSIAKAISAANATVNANSTSSAPVANNTSSAPVANNTSSAPVANNTSSAPVANNTSSAPVANNTASSAPAASSTNSSASASNSTSATNTTTTAPAAPAANINYRKNDVTMSSFAADCVRVHNQQRNAVGLGNVTWDASLAADAQNWANYMAANDVFAHSGATGENIARTTYTNSVLGRLLETWIQEKNWFIVGCKYPSCSSNGDEVGHYTQMVWHSTTLVGCGFAPGANNDWNNLVCRYYKAGNIDGQSVY